MDIGYSLDWSMVAGVVTVLAAIIGQTIAGIRWLNNQFAQRDEEHEKEILDRIAQGTAIRAEATAHREQHRTDLSRLDKEVAGLRGELNVRLAHMPTRDQLEALLRDKVGPIESDMRALVIELARIGVHNPNRRRGVHQDDGN